LERAQEVHAVLANKARLYTAQMTPQFLVQLREVEARLALAQGVTNALKEGRPPRAQLNKVQMARRLREMEREADSRGQSTEGQSPDVGQ
jgi:hypothetical protein